MKPGSKNLLGLAIVGLGLALGSTGCESPPIAGTGSIAWVEIKDHTPREIAQTAKTVLLHQGYKPTHEEREEYIFEKPGNAWNEVIDGNWGEGVAVRLKLLISPQYNDSYLLHCRVYMVRSAGDRVFEDTRELTRLKRKPYQKLLDEIKTTLLSAPEPKAAL
jgi:hypothetical protein